MLIEYPAECRHTHKTGLVTVRYAMPGPLMYKYIYGIDVEGGKYATHIVAHKLIDMAEGIAGGGKTKTTKHTNTNISMTTKTQI